MNIFSNSNFLIETAFDMTGAYHMARDLELAEKLRGDPEASNVLRLYSWKPYCISLGYQQDDSSIDMEACRDAGVDIIRRPTGGRAVYHAEELTYAVIMRFEPSEGIYAVHNKIAESLLYLLQPLCNNELELTDGRSTQTTDRTSLSIRDVYKPGTLTNIACFTSTARYEITWKGKKVVGSAQRRFGNAVLQHGSILLGDEHLRLPELLIISEEDKLQMKKMLQNESATISEICRGQISGEEIAEQIADRMTPSQVLRF
ncbi:MAG: biotin/lipoate A/B protein ligase family protein [Bacteroidota bacterium]|nr:biotin/lipoate A/B protein ligase family protein [Bacteroidota bacterium]MDP4237595.1 biotin/lipoate A/B protein ligase family protein [Bacteroidota bacterium]